MANLPLRTNVLKMTPYTPGKPIEDVKRELGLDRVIKLASNENPLGPSPKAIEAVRKAAEQMHLYPDGAAYSLRHKLSTHFDLPMKQVVVGNGSDEIIHLLGQILLGSPTDEVIVGDPSFVRYDAAAGLSDCVLTKIPVTAEMKLDLPAMAKATNENTRLIFVANPNNPTGTMVSKTELDAFLALIPETVVVVLDEAYFEFAADQPDYPNSLDYVRTYPNVVGMRTFSKAYGLAGIRVGYGFVPEAIADAMDRAREPFNVNLLAQVAAIAALEDTEYVQRTLELNRAGLTKLENCFRENGGTPFKSHANFVMADIGRPARPVFEALLQRGIITRSGDGLGMPTCLRVSIGNEEEMAEFVKVFSEIMSPVTV